MRRLALISFVFLGLGLAAGAGSARGQHCPSCAPLWFKSGGSGYHFVGGAVPWMSHDLYATPVGPWGVQTNGYNNQNHQWVRFFGDMHRQGQFVGDGWLRRYEGHGYPGTEGGAMPHGAYPGGFPISHGPVPATSADAVPYVPTPPGIGGF